MNYKRVKFTLWKMYQIKLITVNGLGGGVGWTHLMLAPSPPLEEKLLYNPAWKYAPKMEFSFRNLSSSNGHLLYSPYWIPLGEDIGGNKHRYRAGIKTTNTPKNNMKNFLLLPFLLICQILSMWVKPSKFAGLSAVPVSPCWKKTRSP